MAWLWVVGRGVAPARAAPPRACAPSASRSWSWSASSPSAAASRTTSRRRTRSRSPPVRWRWRRWTAGRARALRPALAVLMVVGGARRLAARRGPSCRWSPSCATRRRSARSPGTDERQALGRLPQFYADMHGWREMAEAVAGVVRTPAARGPGEGLRLRAELRGGRRDRVLRPRPRPPARDLGPQQLLALGARLLHGRGARRDRRPARAAGGALRRRAARRPSRAARTACPTRTAGRSGSPAA